MQARSWRHQIFAALVALLVTVPAWADPPGRVGRIAWMSGSVQLRNADTGEWNTAVLNWPLTSGDVLSTGPGARAELRIGSTAVRLDSSSEIEILQLDDDRMRVQLDKGSVATRFFSRDDTNGFELVTRVGSFTTPEAGSYRFDYDNNTASATVRRGSLHFESDDSALTIRAGSRADFWYSGATNYSLSDPERDDFSDWVASRERKDERVASARYVPRDMTGIEDLDDNGDWYESTDYGPVWYPRVVETGWAPYRSGHWAWVSPWGWTWVDDAPWGFAPFHYGRWVWYRERWGWVPGRVVARPVYAPALVAWIGTPSFSISISSGPSVGWFPLAPREVYVPSYRCSPAYVRNVNVTHVTNITNVTTIINNPQTVVQQTKYVNRSLPQAVTVVSRDVVERGRPVKLAALPAQDKRVVEALRAEPARNAAPVETPPNVGKRRDSDRDRNARDDGRDQNRAAPGQPGIAPVPGKAAQGDGRDARDTAKPAPKEDKSGDPRGNRNARDARDPRDSQRPAEAGDKPGAQQPVQASPDKRNPPRPDGVGAADERRDAGQKPAPANAAPNVDPRAPAARQERNSDRNADKNGRDARGTQPGDGTPRSSPAPVQQPPGRASSSAPEDAAPRARPAPDSNDARAEQQRQIQQRQTPQRDELQQERQRMLEQQRQQQQRQEAPLQRQEMQQRENVQRQQETQQRQELQRQQEQQRQESQREDAQRQQQQQQRMEQQQRAQEMQQRQQQAQREAAAQQQRAQQEQQQQRVEQQQRVQEMQQRQQQMQQQEMRRQAEAQQQARREAAAQQQRAQQEQQQQQRAQEQQRRAQEERAAQQQKKDNRDDNR